jgi:20S proteasome alpha/beta subunit
LNGLCQTSVLSRQGDRIDSSRLSLVFELTQSTSASPLLLSSIDAARRQFQEYGEELLGHAIDLAHRVRDAVAELPGLELMANVYAQTLGSIFTKQAKPYEVELCVAEVAHYGETKPPELYRITYDGSINDEPHFVVMGGTTEPIATALKESYAENANLADAVRIAVEALRAGSANGGDEPTLGVSMLEVAILDVSRPRRAFRRITGRALEALLPEPNDSESAKDSAEN